MEFVCEIIFSKYGKFWLQLWRHYFKIGSKETKLVSHAPIVIEKWQLKVKGAFRWSIRLWNYFPEILKFKPHVLTSSSQNWVKETRYVISCATGGKNVKIRRYNNLVHSKNEFFNRRISESWNIDPRCEYNRWSVLLIYSHTNTALHHLVIVFLGTWILTVCLYFPRDMWGWVREAN